MKDVLDSGYAILGFVQPNLLTKSQNDISLEIVTQAGRPDIAEVVYIITE
jgi:hypothetical protein